MQQADDAPHSVKTDKHGNSVEQSVSVALTELRETGAAGNVICDYHETGRIQFFADGKYLPGEVVETARDCGYRLDHATTRAAGAVSHDVSGSRCAYAEFEQIDDD